VNSAAGLAALCLPATLAFTFTAPAPLCAGDTAVQVVIEEQLAETVFAPNWIFVPAPIANPVPVIVTLVPPVTEPLFGLTSVIVGASNWKRSAPTLALVPFGVVTVTCTEPELEAGETAVIDVAEFTVTEAALVDPKSTDVAPVNPVPVIVTLVPPAAGPAFGETFLTFGAGPAGT